MARTSPEELKATKLELLRIVQSQGISIAAALKIVDRTRSTYERWRKEDAEFAGAIDRIRTMRKLNPSVEESRGEQMPFPEFSEKYLGAQVFPHMQNVVDMIEGRDPSWLHPAMAFERGEKDLIITNMPPEHGKTTSVTINYVVYRICMDPNIRVILVSKTAEMAKKMLYAIKTRLTHPKYDEMIACLLYTSPSPRDS